MTQKDFMPVIHEFFESNSRLLASYRPHHVQRSTPQLHAPEAIS
jgi:hypothetical protein